MAAAQVPVTVMTMTRCCYCKVTCLSSMLKNMCAIIKIDKYTNTYLLYFSSISKAKAILAGAGYI